MTATRRRLIAAVLALSGCAGGDGAPVVAKPLRYDYLTPIRLNVASLEVTQSYVPGGNDVGPTAPVPPAAALRQMATDRLFPAGASGRAVFVIQDAAILRTRGNYQGSLVARLEVSGAGGSASGYAEARVSRIRTIPDGGPNTQRQALYDMTRQMMDDMNVELEYQIRRSLRDWVQTPSAPAAGGPVERQDLAPPGAASPKP